MGKQRRTTATTRVRNFDAKSEPQLTVVVAVVVLFADLPDLEEDDENDQVD